MKNVQVIMWQKKEGIGYLCDFIKRILLATCHLDEETAGELLWAFDSSGERHLFR